MNHIFIILIIIVVIGGLAGTTNFLYYFFKGNIKSKYEIIKYIMSGIGAAILVPLLLNMMSSNLIRKVESFDPINYFVFAGFCFIAGYFSDRFINSVGDKILRDLENTNNKVDSAINSLKESEEKIDFIVSSESEAEDSKENEYIDPEELVFSGEDDDMKTHISKIVLSFTGRYKFRTVRGIAKELNYNENIVSTILLGLQDQGIAKRFTKRDGNPIWGLTQIGIQVSNVYKKRALQDEDPIQPKN